MSSSSSSPPQDAYDVVVVGTGLAEAIFAGACARAGKSVLFMDRRTRYGGDDGTLSLGEFRNEFAVVEQTATSSSLSQTVNDAKSSDADVLYRFTTEDHHLFGFRALSSFNDANSLREEELRRLRHQILIEMKPRFFFSRGMALETVIESGVSRYMEFQNVDGVYHLEEDSATMMRVLHSKSEVFQASNLSMLEKRQLMRFLQACVDVRGAVKGETSAESSVMEAAGWSNETGELREGRALSRPQNKPLDAGLVPAGSDEHFETYLEERVRMTSRRLREAVIHGPAGAMRSSQPGLTSLEAIRRINTYLSCVGRYTGSTTPFLATHYGTGAVCESFARLCAIYGGTCVLDVRPQEIRRDTSGEGVAILVLDPGERGAGLLPTSIRARRGIVVGLLEEEEEEEYELVEVRCVCLVRGNAEAIARGTSLLSCAPSISGGNFAVRVLQMDSKTLVVPSGYVLFHLSTLCDKGEEHCRNAVARMRELVMRALTSGGEIVLPPSFFARKLASNKRGEEITSVAPYLTMTFPTVEEAEDVGYDAAFARAKRLFERYYPGEEFLPASETERKMRQIENQEESLKSTTE